MSWAAQTNFWTLGMGTSLRLTTSCVDGHSILLYPPDGIDLPILLVDGTVAKSKVVSSSPSEIVIELENGHRRRMIPIAPRLPTGTNEFPGLEWILRERV